MSGAHASYLDGWRISGQGLAAYSRKSLDGGFVFALAFINFFRGGLENVAIGDTVSEDEFRRDLLDRAATEAGYLMEPTQPETAATLLWGSYEFMTQGGFDLPPNELDRLRHLVPCPHGGPRGCLAALTASGGAIHPQLLRIARRLGTDVEMPNDKEQLVFTTARFRVSDGQALLAWMRESEPDISEEGEEEDGLHFTWTRAYPKGHWSPFSRQRGARQMLGDAVVRGEEIRIETKTPSWAARFAQLLHQRFPSDLLLAGVDWKSWKDLAEDAR